MIEKVLYDYLNGALSVPAYLERPDPCPKSFVLFEKTGSNKTNHLKRATFAFQSYAPSLYEAAVLNEQVKEAVEAAIGLPEITSVQLNSDYNFSNTARREHRYQAVFEIVHY